MYIYLHNRVKKKYVSELSRDRLVVCSSAVSSSFKEMGFYVEEINLNNYNCEKELAEKVSIEFSKISDEEVKELVRPFLNEYFSYSLRISYLINRHVFDLIKRFSPGCVTIISPGSRMTKLPFYGFVTTESKRGSSKLYNAVCANVLADKITKYHPNILVARFCVGSDFLCFNLVRKAFYKLLNAIFLILMVLQCLILSFAMKSRALNSRVSTNKKEEVNFLIIARAPHHYRFAEKFSSSLSGAKIALFPQSTQLNLLGNLSFIKKNKNEEKLFGYSPLDVMHALKRHAKTLNKLRRKSNSFSEELRFKYIDYRWLLQELRAVSVVYFYKEILTVSVKQPVKRLLSFEISGRAAAFETAEMRKKNIPSVSYQTVVVSSKPLVFFPLHDIFLSDSSVSNKNAKSIGSIREGECLFKGVHNISEGVSPVSGKSIVTFFTQPYEHEVTLLIIKEIADWARQKNSTLNVKLHPRDSESYYKEIIDYKEVEVTGGSNPTHVINSSDIVVTRTSSVAKEALLLGKPIILCLFSDFDKKVEVDFINKNLKSSVIVRNASDLLSLLNDKECLLDANLELKNWLYQSDDCGNVFDYLSLLDAES
ncbi:hypothetical protein [Halomonas sp. 3H]|uniref:hypothetical protein n=1 Tax=Halomonas sp. 3H TaxID=2952527 RepID=UPI0020B78EA8|nr:hypothetical protein [Halomonas sp. 3H]